MTGPKFMCLCLVLLLSCALVAADTCVSLSATFTSPQICYPTYSIPGAYNNNTYGNQLSNFFRQSTGALPSLACAEAFAAYYCEKFYPECDATTNTAKVGCADTCNAVVSACANDADAFQDPQVPLPTAAQCSQLSSDDTACSATPETNLTSLYTECAPLNQSLFSPNPKINTPICQPTYSVPVGNISYTPGDTLFNTFRYSTDGLNDTQLVDIYPCLKAFSAFICGDAYPACPAGNALPILPVCQSTCTNAISQCAKWSSYFTTVPGQTVFLLPTAATCNQYPTVAGSCFVPGNNDTNTTFYTGGDPPIVVTPTPTPGPIYYTTPVKYPPGGPTKGGVIGAGILVGILLFIGLLSLIMKKQDSR